MYIAKNYQTDGGITLNYSVAIYINYDGEGYRQNITTNPADPLVPSFLLSELQWFARPCPTKEVIARYVIVTLVTGDMLQIGCPFRPGTAEWFAFWAHLQSPKIISAKSFGEKITNKFLRNSLGIT